MNQCLRCGKACEQDLFCETCQSALLHRSLQKQETPGVLAQASLGRHVSLAEQESRENTVLGSAKQTSSFLPAQGVISGRGRSGISDKVSLAAEQSTRLASSQAPSLQSRRLSHLKHIFTILIILTIIAVATDGVLASLVTYRHLSHGNKNTATNTNMTTNTATNNQSIPMTVWGSSNQSARSTNGSSPHVGSTPTTSNTSTATPSALPALSISPTNMTFSVTQGEKNPPSQAVTVANTGGDSLSWQARIDTAPSSWLQVSPETGSVTSGQNGHIFLSVDTGSLSLGTYKSNVVVSATDKSGTQVSGSPQAVSIVLNVLQPCTLNVTPTNQTFSASLLAPEPPGQDITLQTGGNCAYPVTWTATVDANSSSWLILSETSGQDNGNGNAITVHVNTKGMLLGSYQGQIAVSASDGNNTSVKNATPTVDVGLTVIG